MKKIIVFSILFGMAGVALSAPVQWAPQDVHISATVPYGVVDFPPPSLTTLLGAPEGVPIIQIINLTDTSCEIVWGTVENSNSIIEYGETSDYGTTVIDWELVKSHKLKLTNLTPKTAYHFRVKSRTDVGKESVSLDYIFKTLDLTAPANISNFVAKPEDKMITLNWQNPPDKDFTGVKIQMSTKMYPANPAEGVTVYDGKGEFGEVSPLQNGTRYYFTAFSYDDAKNYASGAIASAVPTREAVPGLPEVFIPPELAPKISELKIGDFSFFIEGQEIFPKNGAITVKPGQTFKVSIPVEKLPKVLKTLLIIIGFAQNQEGTQTSSSPLGCKAKLYNLNVAFAAEVEQLISSYLLRINAEETAYEAILTAPQIPSNYPLTIMIMDFKEGTVAKIDAKLKVLKVEGEATRETRSPLAAEIGRRIEEKVSFKPLLILISIILTIGALIGYSLGKKLKRKNN